MANRRPIGWILTGLSVAWLLPVSTAGAQTPVVVSPTPYRINNAFAAPGYYGVSYGTPGYGSVRAYSAFSSPYGGIGYGYGYPPYGLLPGKFGVGLWRPGYTAPGYLYGASYTQTSYSTYPVPYTPSLTAPAPPVGMYAPAYGPSTGYGW